MDGACGLGGVSRTIQVNYVSLSQREMDPKRWLYEAEFWVNEELGGNRSPKIVLSVTKLGFSFLSKLNSKWMSSHQNIIEIDCKKTNS